MMHPDSTDHWVRVSAAFDAVADLPTNERLTALDRLDLDAEARAEVEALLTADLAADAEAWSLELETVAALVSADPLPGERVGPWRVVGELGRGGMGRVDLVERADGSFDQTAALKRLRLVAPERVRRFTRERQILATLEHGGIARLLDGGVGEDGTPYLVMERVEGQPITDWAGEHDLGVRARVCLFLQVCDAVGHAHRHLVVHRDLKPSNVFVSDVDGEPQVKLLDFGIARLLDEEGDGVPTGLPLLTPEYAAPEQVEGSAVSTATDVYALGILLYELLAGQRPYRVDRQALGGIVAAVRDAQPEPPSHAAPEGRRRVLRGDLDTVVMKALAKEPVRRYGSAGDLGDDLRRALAGEPVEARPATAAYRIRRFIGRHRAGVGAIAFAFLAVSASVAFYTGRLADERDRANAEAARAESTTNFLVDLLADASPYDAPVDSITVLDALMVSETRIDTVLAGQPTVQGDLFATIGTVYTSLGRFEDAERTLAKADRYLREAGDPVRLGVSLIGLGRLALFQGQSAEADSILTRALGILGDPAELGSPGYGPVASALISRGGAHHWLGDLDGAVADYEAGIRVAEEADLVDDRLDGMTALVAALSDRGEYDRALRTVREVIAERRRLFPEGEIQIAHTQSQEARVLRALDRFSEAEAASRDAVSVRARVLGEDNAETATDRSGLAQSLIAQGKVEEAEALLDQVEPVYVATYGPEHPSVGGLYRYRAHAAIARGDLATAEAEYRRALVLLSGLTLAVSRPSQRSTVELAEVLDLDGQAVEARRLLDGVPDSVLAATPHFQAIWGVVLARTGRPEIGVDHARAAVDSLRAERGPVSWRTARAELHLARALASAGRTDAARQVHARATRGLREIRGPRSAYATARVTSTKS